MLDQVILETATPMTLNVTAVDPDDIIVVKSISGLSPADVTLFTGDFARDGGYYQGRRAVKRNPVFNFKLNPDYAADIEVSDIRELLYQMFLEPMASTDGVQVRLVDDRKPDRYFIGYTEKIETDMWVKEQTAQVSLICVDPYLKSVSETTGTDVAGWTSIADITYDGSAATGLEMVFECKTNTSEMYIDIGGVVMHLVKNFVVGDDIIVNTTIGSRSITLNGVDIMGSLTGASKWVYLNPVGLNAFKVYGSVVNDGDVVMKEYTFRSSWWGI